MAKATALTIDDYLTGYQEGRIEAVEQLRAIWGKLEQQGCGPDGDTAIIYLPTKEQQAQLLEALLALDAKDCPLWGVPFVVKDNIDIASWPTTAACPGFQYVAADSASVVKALMQAGAVPMAKANLDQFATGLVGTRSPYGWVRNAFSAQHISGGSSSGSASVVARGLVPFALGTDTAGSGRVPAAFNNLVGAKPTPGRFSIEGVVPACKTLDCVSILSLTVEDAARVSSVLAKACDGADEPRFHVKPAKPLFAFAQKPRIGIPINPLFTDEAYASLYQETISAIEQAWSVQCVPLDMTVLDAVAKLLYTGPWVTERYVTARASLEKQVPGLDPTVKTIVEQGAGFTSAQTFEAMYTLKELAAQAELIWRDVDVLCLPSAPGLPTYEAIQNDPIGANSVLGTYTNFVNLLGWAALATPAGFTNAGLPFGVTWVAPGGSDDALLALGARWAAYRALPLGANLRDAGGEHPPLLTAPDQDCHPIAVVGAHLSGMPLNGQLQTVGARLKQVTKTSESYRLYHIPNTTPPKPGLVRVQEGGRAIALEVYDVPSWAVSTFLAQIPSPLGLGKIELTSGDWVTGFICEPWACEGATDVSQYGGWRAYIEAAKK